MTQYTHITNKELLQELPFYETSDREYHALTNSWSCELDDRMDIYNMLPNPDKFDAYDSDQMLTFPTSNYTPMQKIHSLLERSGTDELSLFHFNVRSLEKNIDILKEFVISVGKKPSVLAISESKLNENTVSKIELKGYEFYHTDSSTNAGGAALYVSEDIKNVEERKDIKFNTELVESCWIEIDNENKSNIIIGSIYRHPNSNIIEFTTELETILKELNNNKYQVFITGDINIDFFKYNFHGPTEEYLDMLYANNFFPLITKPTRITDHSQTLIDHIYTNYNFDKIKPGIAIFDISDHLPVFSLIQTKLLYDNKTILYRDYKNFDTELYLKDLREVDWDSILQAGKDLHESAAEVVRKIEHIANNHAPMKQLPRNKKKLFSKPWITNGMLQSIKNKQKMYRTHFFSKNTTKVLEYKKYSNKLNKILNQAKREYFNNRFEQCKYNIKLIWKMIGTIIDRKTKGQTLPTKIRSSNKDFKQKKDIANQFNNYFINVGPELSKNIVETDICPTDYISTSPVSSLAMSPITHYEVANYFKQLNENKSTIGTPNKLIKIAAKELSIPLTKIYNESLQTGIVPDVFKISRVTPIHKSNNPQDLTNYRPVATLSPFSKILEKIVNKQLQSFLDKEHILYKYQFGFRKNYSTEQAILEITDNMKSNIDNKLITCGLFLDFCDTVNHDILLQKLFKYGIRGIPHSWFKSYLENRQQYVKINETESDKQIMKCGVPQGSTLGPLLFLLYINDMPNSSTKLMFRIFADDTNLFYAAKTAKELETVMNKELQNVLQYCIVNKLSVNFEKTNFMIITSKKQKPTISIPNIEQKEFIKYLGVYIDNTLSWSYHIKHINSRISKNTGIIYKLRHYLNLKMLKQIYYSLIYPYLNYAILSWGNTYKTRLMKISTKQNKVVRAIFFANSRESAKPFFQLLNLLSLENIFKFKCACLTYKIINKDPTIPEPLQDYITLSSSIHSYNTRYSTKQNILRKKVRTNYGKQKFEFVSSQIWEKVPEFIKNRNSFFSFKTYFKAHLLNQK